MKLKKLTIILAFCAVGANAHGQSADSTSLGSMSGNMTSLQNKIHTINSGNYTSGTMASSDATSVTKITNGTCPAGMTFNGSSQYPMSAITVTTYYINGKVVGTNTSPTVYYNNDCSKTEYQDLYCPAGYSGSIRQSRTVAGSEGDLQYGTWTTVYNTCTPPPPPPPPPPPVNPCYSTRYCNMRDALYTYINGKLTVIPGTEGTGPCLQELGETYCNGKYVSHCNYTIGLCWNW